MLAGRSKITNAGTFFVNLALEKPTRLRFGCEPFGRWVDVTNAKVL